MGAIIKHINNILSNPNMDEVTRNDVVWQYVDFMLVGQPLLFNVHDTHKNSFYRQACRIWTQL
jgi:hypothetical protein